MRFSKRHERMYEAQFYRILRDYGKDVEKLTRKFLAEGDFLNEALKKAVAEIKGKETKYHKMLKTIKKSNSGHH